MKRTLQTLLVEDSENDALLLELALQRAGYAPVCQRVDTAAALAAVLECQGWDLVIADYRMPELNGLEALALVKGKGLDLPFIIVSGQITDDTAVAAMKAGAHDYVMKDNLFRLGPAVERELREVEVRRERRRSEEQRRQAEEALRRAHDELELRVEQRTLDLASANAKLQAAIAERRRLEHELLEITERERRRIGLDLHDNLGQELSGIALMTKGLELKLAKLDTDAAQDAGRIHRLIQQTMDHASDLAHDLATLDFEENDLPAALRDLAAHTRKLFGIGCRFQAQGPIPPLEANTVAQLYKIAQESVTNAIKHGKAGRVSLNLTSTAGKLLLTIQNNGLPFPDLPDHSTAGMGLRIMNYRAHLIGGLLEIKGAGAHGTRVACSVPLP